MEENEPISFGATPSLFLEWRSPRFGDRNPSKLDNPVWEWLVRKGLYDANKMLKGPSSLSNGPVWCFDRFGQTETPLPDGRVIFIGGEHEDHYDPDFYIYNDVVVINPDQSIEIYGYSKECFPPTDFHSATLIKDKIVIIGSLGYSDHRPDVVHQELPQSDDEYGIYRISVNGVTVRYVEEIGCIQVTVEGQLPSKVIESLKSDCLNKLSDLENIGCIIEPISG